MRKRVFVVAAVGIAAVLVAGGLVASNMGFKAAYMLEDATSPNSLTGTQTIALPYNQQTNLLTAEDLIDDINLDAAGVAVASISRVKRTDDDKDTYSGAAGQVPFNLVPGEGYIVVVTAPVNYIIVGSHNPNLALNLDAQGTNLSKSGTQLWSMPYHFMGSDAEDLIAALEVQGGAGSVASVSRLKRIDDQPESYSGAAGQVPFTLTPGEAYVIVVNSDITNWKPPHF